MLTVSRITAAPFIGYCILHDHHAWALGLFAYAGITDLLDGWIARKWNLGTVVGTVIDPMADKSLMMVLTIALALKGTLPGEWSDFLSQRGSLLTEWRMRHFLYSFVGQNSLAIANSTRHVPQANIISLQQYGWP